MSIVVRDVWRAVRILTKKPGTTAVSVLALALGIGVNVTLFTGMSAIVLHPLPYPNLDRIVTVWESIPKLRAERDLAAAGNYLDWKKSGRSFEHLAAYRAWDVNLTGGGDPVRIRAAQVSSDFFPVLGMKPALGRVFSADDEKTGGDARVAVVSQGFWQRRLSSNPNVLGRTVSLDNRTYTIVGVMPVDFDFPLATELWTPLIISPREANDRGERRLAILGLLRKETGIGECRREMETIAGRLASEYPKENGERSVTVMPLRELGDQVSGRFVMMLQGAAGFVLLLACANVASLQLARAVARQKQFAVETALGESRIRVAWQLLAECIALGLIAGGVGYWLASWYLELGRTMIPPEVLQYVAGLAHIRLDSSAALFTLLISLLAGILSGLPAIAETLRYLKTANLGEALKEGGRQSGSSADRGRLRGVLVGVEMALALVLLVGTGMMVRTMQAMFNADLGFNQKNLLTMQIALPVEEWRESARISGYYDRVLSAAAAVHGVGMVGGAADMGAPGGLYIEGRPEPRAGEPRPNLRAVSDRYFETMQIPIRQGRPISSQDGPNSARVVVLSETIARYYWPDGAHGSDPIGRRIRLGSQSPWLTVVGVCEDVKDWFGHRPIPYAYVPYRQTPQNNMMLLVRTAGDPMGLAGATYIAIRGIDRNPPVYDVKSMEQILAWQTSGVSAAVLSMSVYGVIALILAITGIYAVTSHSVERRTHEIGIRMSLGARGADVLGTVVGQTFAMAGAGLAVGLGAAFFLNRIVSSLLYGVVPMDGRVFAAATFMLGFSALAAAYIPARRAVRVDPVSALRHE